MIAKFCCLTMVYCSCMVHTMYADFSNHNTTVISPENALDMNNPAAVEAFLLTILSGPKVVLSPDRQASYCILPTIEEGGAEDIHTFTTRTFPAPPIALRTGIDNPVGIAISSDSSTGLVAAGGVMPGLYTFPTGGVEHTATRLFTKSLVIEHPQYIAISGSTAYISDSQSNAVYSASVDSDSYSATAIQYLPSNGLAVSSDGYLYIASNKSVYRVPLSSPTDMPTLVAKGSFNGDIAGLAVSLKGDRVSLTTIDKENGDIERYWFSTNQEFPQIPALTDFTGLFHDLKMDKLLIK